MNGRKFVHDPKWNANAQNTSKAKRPSLSQVVQRNTAAPMRMLKIFKSPSAQMTQSAMSLGAADGMGEKYNLRTNPARRPTQRSNRDPAPAGTSSHKEKPRRARRFRAGKRRCHRR